MLQCAVVKIPASEQLLICGDWNGHIGAKSTSYREVHGGQTIGQWNTEGVLEFAVANKLVVENSSNADETQINYVRYRCASRKQVSNMVRLS